MKKINSIFKCFAAAFLVAVLFAVFTPQQHADAASASVTTSSKVTYGSKVYYGSYDYTNKKRAEIYRNNASGTNEKLLTTIQMTGSDTQLIWKVHVFTVYNNKLYFSVSWEKEWLGEGALYTLSLKTGKCKKILDDFFPLTYSGKCGRYIYGTDVQGNCIRIFDCKKGKVIRKINCTSARSLTLSISGGKLYYANLASSKIIVYRIRQNGSGKKEKLLSLKNPSDSYWQIGSVIGKKIYYKKVIYGGGEEYYLYNVKTKKTIQITEEEAGDQKWIG